MVRRIVALGLLCGSLAYAQPADAQGLWLGGVGYGAPGFYETGAFPYGFGNAVFFGAMPPATVVGYPVAAPVLVSRPVVYAPAAPAFIPRPAVRLPLNRAYRRAYRFGW